MLQNIPKYKKVCEIGPGARPIVTELPENCELYAIEYPGCAEETIKAVNRKNKTIVIKECDLNSEKWPFDDSEFDVIVSNQVLEHMSNTDHFFEEFFRIMRPDAHGVISKPNLSSLHNILQLLITLQPVMCNASNRFYGVGNLFSSHRGEKRNAPFHCHLRIFSIRAMVELCNIYGLRVEKKCGGTFMGIPVIGRFLGRIIPWYSYYCTLKVRKT